ncbi:hydroxymethylglutaryl-CoA lyase [Amycolatopsis sp.]|jgi:hydroxymethylglutaryl-CoA lyase|uniref:hydroxymethylglutaryl-CoA lyase n=1 Tax=Amycolatopsis sp. TaxID=37632 RepID=UPI002E05CE32|nr:hydroxymethylglutaryl-CoA lyase [Amycolatopsis sp.]
MTGLTLPAAINLREVGPRDGLQIEKPISTDAKLELLANLADAGLRRIEATAFVSPRAVPALTDAAEVAAELHNWPGVSFSALVAGVGGARRAVDAGIRDLEYVVSAADGHSMANVRCSTAAALEQVREIVELAHDAGGTCEVIIATAWDCPFDGPTPRARTVAVSRRAVEQGADRLCLGDTIGTAAPGRVASLVSAVRAQNPGVPLGLHMHNTRGAGLAGVLAALQLGIVDIDASIGGLGGCPFARGATGNIATEELAYLCADSGIETGTDLGKLITAARWVQGAVGRTLPSGILRAGDRRRNSSSRDIDGFQFAEFTKTTKGEP